MACDVPPCIGSVREQPTQPTPPGTNRPAGTPGVLAARAPVTAVRCASERAPVRGHPRAKSILKPALNLRIKKIKNLKFGVGGIKNSSAKRSDVFANSAAAGSKFVWR